MSAHPDRIAAGQAMPAELGVPLADFRGIRIPAATQHA
jgi:hypothetical protein